MTTTLDDVGYGPPDASSELGATCQRAATEANVLEPLPVIGVNKVLRADGLAVRRDSVEELEVIH